MGTSQTCPSCGHAPPGHAPSCTRAAETGLATGPRTGARCGDYVLRERLGEGPHGSVYAAEHLRSKARVAVKLARPEAAADPLATEWFLSVARTANATPHQAMADVFGFGRDDAGSVYLVMQLLEGETLAARVMRSGPLPVPDALALLEAVLSVLEALHGDGHVHGNLKPTNVFLVADQAKPRVRVLDPAPIGEATPDRDLHDAGALFFLALTGQPPPLPLRGDTRPSTLRAEVPSPLDDLVQRLLDLHAPPPSAEIAHAEAVRLLACVP